MTTRAQLDAPIDELTVDAYGDHEQLTGFPTGAEDALRRGAPARIVGVDVQALAIDAGPDAPAGLTARVRRAGATYEAALADLAIDADTKTPGSTTSRITQRRDAPAGTVHRRRLAARPAAMTGTRRAQAALVSRIARVLPAAVVAAVLWVIRPGLPRLPDSLAGPVTIDQLEDLLVFLGWLALLVVLLLATARHARTTTGASRAMPTPTNRRREHTAEAIARAVRVRVPTITAPTLTISAPPDEHPTAGAATETAVAAQMAVEPRAPQVRVSLLGSFSIERLDGTVRGVRSSTEQLIAYLALRPSGATRDELAEAIWPGDDPRRTRRRLWQSTSEARKLIGDAFISHRGHYTLDRTRIIIDADELEMLLADAMTATSPAAERRVLERGLGLPRGEPLAAWDHVWADTDAARLRATQAELLERLSRARLETDDAHGALEAAEQGLDRDSLNEALWRLAMEAEPQLGLRESVGRRYERLRGLLDEQLGLEPETETRTLYRDLLGQR